MLDVNNERSERSHDHDRSLYRNIRNVTMLMKRLAVPHEVENGVVLPPKLSTLDAECTGGTTIPCCCPRRSSSLKTVALDNETVGEEEVDDAAKGLISVVVEVGGVGFADVGESRNVSLWCG